MFPCFFCIVGRDVELKSDMHPKELEIKDYLASSNGDRHILFLAAKDDRMIHYTHSQLLYDCYRGANKKIVLFEGTHNSDRPTAVLNQIFSFAENALFNEKVKPLPCNADSRKVELDSN
jgi:hypothetical protein